MSLAQQPDSIFLQENPQTGHLSLTEAGASHFAQLALKCLQQEYPNKLSHVMHDSSEVLSPQTLHPAFYGCFDWHSAVHGHWMLVYLLREFPTLPEAEEIRQKIDQNLQVAHIQAEVAYLNQPGRKSFERMYGWAWLLKLAEALHTWPDPQAQRWSRHLQPLTDAIVDRYLDFLPRQTYPIRTGLHPNTAFGLSFAWDYALSTGHQNLRALISQTAQRYYAFDVNCPADWEPGGSDFLSPCLVEADLMQRILSPTSFQHWLSRFLPGLPQRLQLPATVSDRSDGQIVHLDGLNLSRGWCMLGIAQALPQDDPRRQGWLETANLHIRTTLPHIASGDYAGEHWLASFAVFALSLE